jgi:hypothetical protein
VSLSASYVRKNARNQIGWVDTAGVYGTQTVTVSGQTLTVFPQLNTGHVYLRTNGPGYFSRYDGLILNLTRRFQNRWMATAGYTYSVSQGLQPTGNAGRDPNDYINLTGRLSPQDRPHTVNVFGSYEVPKVAVQVSGQLAAVNGTPYASQVLVSLPQGRRTINATTPGTYRTPEETYLQFRLTKILFRTGNRHVELTGEARNALQNLNSTSIITRIIGNPNFGLPASWPDPRQLILLAKVFY